MYLQAFNRLLAGYNVGIRQAKIVSGQQGLISDERNELKAQVKQQSAQLTEAQKTIQNAQEAADRYKLLVEQRKAQDEAIRLKKNEYQRNWYAKNKAKQGGTT